MKKSKLFLGALSLLALAACSDDKTNEPVNPVNDGAKAYVNIAVMTSTPGGRAGAPTEIDFNDGSESENTIKEILLVFYDDNRNYIGDATLTESDWSEEGDWTWTSGNPNDELSGNVEKYGSGVAEVSLGGVIPKYMMAFANPINSGDIKVGVNAVKLQERSVFKTNNGFTMNNSVYFDKDGKIQREVEVKANQVFKSKEEAKNAGNEGLIKVWLERMAGKVTLSGKTGSETSLPERTGTLDGKQLKFVVEGWGLNATAKKMYLSKFYKLTEGLTFASLSERLNSFYWNDADRYRSYWAFSPAYSKPNNNTGVDFPYVSDQVTSNSKFDYYPFKSFLPKEENETDNIVGTHRKPVGATEYTLENTVSMAFYTKGCDYRNSALVSAVVVGHYEVFDTKEQTYTKQNFYVRNEKIYLEEDFKKEMAIIAGGYLVNAQGNSLNKDNYTSGLFTITRPDKNWPTPEKGIQENRITVKLSSVEKANEAGLKYKADIDAEAVEINAKNIDEINKKIYDVCGLSYAYTNGYAFFNIPIEHLAKGTTSGNVTDADNNLIEAGNPVAGSYGIVRNHHYNIIVNGWEELSIATLGTGVYDPGKPVVPPTDPSDKIAVKAEIRILSWRLVKQDVTLGKQ